MSKKVVDLMRIFKPICLSLSPDTVKRSKPFSGVKYNAGNYCTDICIKSELYCNGNIDMPGSNSSIFIKNYSTLNYTIDEVNYMISNVLLYPDELYCSNRLHAVFMLAYVLTFVSFSFSIALIVRTRPLLHFLIRRRAKELKKKMEMLNNADLQ